MSSLLTSMLVVRYNQKAKATAKPLTYSNLIAAAKELFPSLGAYNDQDLAVEAILEGYGEERIGIPSRSWDIVRDRVLSVWIELEAQSESSGSPPVTALDFAMPKSEEPGTSPATPNSTHPTLVGSPSPLKNNPSNERITWFVEPAPSSRGKAGVFEVTIQTSVGAVINIKLKETFTLRRLRALIERRFGVPAAEQVVCGEKLQLPFTAEDRIPAGARIQISQESVNSD